MSDRIDPRTDVDKVEEKLYEYIREREAREAEEANENSSDYQSTEVTPPYPE